MATDSDSINVQEQLQRYGVRIKERWYTVAVIAVIFLLLGVGLAQLWPSRYQASTLFSLHEAQLIEDSTLERSLTKIRLAARRQTLSRELRSQSRMREVLEMLEWEEYVLAQADPTGRELSDLYRKVSKALQVEIQGDTLGDTLVTLTFTWNDPYKAADFLNTMRDHWIDVKIQKYQEDYQDRLDRAEVVIRERKQACEQAVKALEEFDRENNFAALGTVEENNRLKADLTAAVTAARAKVESMARRIAQLEKEVAELEPTLNVPKKQRNPEYVKLELQWKKAYDRLRIMQEKYTDAKPELIKQKEIVAALKKQLDAMKESEYVVEEISGVPNEVYNAKIAELDRLKSEYDVAKETLKSSEKQLERLEENIGKLPLLQAERRALEGNVTVAEDLYHKALEEAQPIQDRVNTFKRIRMKGGVYQPEDTFRNQAFEVLTPAVPPKDPVNSLTFIIIIASFFVGLGLGLLAVLLGEFIKSSFTTREEVARFLQRPVLGAVSPILTEAELRALQWRKAVFTSSTLLLIFCLAAILYICNAYPELIPKEIVERVNRIRASLG